MKKMTINKFRKMIEADDFVCEFNGYDNMHPVVIEDEDDIYVDFYEADNIEDMYFTSTLKEFYEDYLAHEENKYFSKIIPHYVY